jgi:hypothetical protein
MTVAGRLGSNADLAGPCYDFLMKKSQRPKRSGIGAKRQLADDLSKLIAEVAGSVTDLPADLSERKKWYLKKTGYGLDREAARRLRTRKTSSRD